MNEEFIKKVEYSLINDEADYFSPLPLPPSLPPPPLIREPSMFVNILYFFMVLFFLQTFFDKDHAISNYLEAQFNTNVLDRLNFYFYNENDLKNIENENSDKEQTPDDDAVTIKPPKIYEEKYLEEIKKLADEIIFTDVELARELEQQVIIRKTMEDKLNSDKKEVEKQLAYLEKKQNDIECGKDDDEDYEDECEDEDGYKKLDVIIEDRKQHTLANIQLEKDLYKKGQRLLEDKKIEDEEVNKLAREFILKERLDNLKNNIILEKTPLGNVVMFYNNARSSFEYYSDSTIPYRYLEVIARKYILTYKCKQIYVDMAQEIKEAEQKLEDKKQKQKDEEEKQKQKQEASGQGSVVKPVKNVFAKFKNYNKDTNIHAAVVPADRPTAAKQTKPQEEKIVKERANRYSFEGKLANFNFLKKVDRKVVDKRYAVSFAEFKKMQKNQ